MSYLGLALIFGGLVAVIVGVSIVRSRGILGIWLRGGHRTVALGFVAMIAGVVMAHF